MNTGPTALVSVSATLAAVPHESRSAVDAKPAADAAALFLLGLLFFLLICFVLSAVALARRSRRHPGGGPRWDTAKVEQGPLGEQNLPRAEWEREADWWKK